MEILTILVTIIVAIIFIIFGYIFIMNTLHQVYATEGDKVKFYELEDKIKGIIVKDNGVTVEVEYFYYDDNNFIKRQVAVVSRKDIYKY